MFVFAFVAVGCLQSNKRKALLRYIDGYPRKSSNMGRNVRKWHDCTRQSSYVHFSMQY